MADTKKEAPAKAEAKTEDKPKRARLTPEERIAKAEAELREARQKAAHQADKKLADLHSDLEKAEAAAAKANAKVEAIKYEIDRNQALRLHAGDHRAAANAKAEAPAKAAEDS